MSVTFLTDKDEVLRYDKQKLTDEQKAQARENIGVGAGGSGMGGADWNAAEGEPGHVLNRTHWEEYGARVEIVPETTHVLQNSDTTTLQTPFGITLGKTYIVNWNGAEYKCEPYTVLIGGVHKATALGDNSHFANDFPAAGEPFGIMEIDEKTASADGFGGVRVFIHPKDADPSGHYEYTISIAEVSDVVHKLDPKFLPDGVPYIAKGTKATVVSECQPAYDEEEGLFIISGVPAPLAAGQAITVNWNGVKYDCVLEDMSTMAPGAVAFGNTAAIGLGSSGEDLPFTGMWATEDSIGAIALLAVDGSTELTVEITGVFTTARKLDVRCLPEEAVTDILIVKPTDGSMSAATHTGTEIFMKCRLGGKLGFFHYYGRTLPLTDVWEEGRAFFECLGWSGAADNTGYLVLNRVTVEADGTISESGSTPIQL